MIRAQFGAGSVRPVVVVLACGLLLCGCAPPETAQLTSAAPIHSEDRQLLTSQAEAIVERLKAVADGGDWRDMVRLASANVDFHSNDAGWSHASYWYLKLRTGDWPTRQMGRILAYRHGVKQTPDGRVFVWPYMAALAPGEINAAAAHDMDELAGEGEAERVRAGGRWSGYSLGVREDGTWLWFASGSDEITDQSAEASPPA
jgi:hypothetical protein